MTVVSENRKNQYNCDGVQVVFPYTFLILAAAHLLIVHRDAAGGETELVLNSDYTVDGIGNPSGGDVTTTATYPVLTTLTITRDVPVTQEIDYIENDIFPADSHERALDKLTMLIQELLEKVSRAILGSITDIDPDLELPNSTLRAGKLLSFDEEGDVDLTDMVPAEEHASSHMVGGGDLVNHDNLPGFVAAEHLSLPNLIANILSDHTKAVHDALGLSHDSLADVSVDDHHAQAHAHYGETLECRAIDWDGGSFTIYSTAKITLEPGTSVELSACVNAGVDTNKFLVLDLNSNIDYRTGAEVWSDIDGDGAILTHKNIATAHQDAPALILTHKNIVDAHHVKYLNSEAVAAVEAAGLVLATTKVINSVDEDLLFNFGRAYVGYMSLADGAGFGHRDHASAVGYALLQAASGTVNLNAPTGQNINFKINGVLKGEMNASGLTLHVISAEATDVDKFLVSNAGLVKYRTGAQVLSDIGGTALTLFNSHATRHHVGGADLVNHDSLTGFVGAEHKSLPNTIAEVLSNHTKAVHDALGLDHGSLSGKADDDHSQYYNAARHTKAVHDALGLSHDSLADVSANDHHPQVHVHDGDTLQLDAILSNGGVFQFTTSDRVIFSRAIQVDEIGHWSPITIDTYDNTQPSVLYILNSDPTFKASLNVEDNIIVGGLVDARDVAVDGAKLDEIEAAATADQTKADIDALGLSHDSLVDVSINDHHARDHAATHGPAAADALKLDDLAAPDDVTDLNASITKHGLLKKLDNIATNFLNGQGNWAAAGGAGIPSGVILLWSGAVGDIPAGWVLCNGANSTPDLRDKFIVGAGSAYAVDATGGASTMAHTHSIPSLNSALGGIIAGGGVGKVGKKYGTTNICYGAGDQIYPLKSYTVAGTSQGASNTENRPPYYALCYIMKT